MKNQFTFKLKTRGGSRTAATSKMECFVIIVNGFQPLTIITKHSILDVAAVLDPPLKTTLIKKKLVCMYQSGFRTNHSTDICLDQLIDFVLNGMDKQMHTGMILVDLQKAFDTLDHGILLEKMIYFGFQTSVFK